MKIICNTSNGRIVILQLKQEGNILDELSLTVDQRFDTLLITGIDKLLIRNKIERLSLKALKIQGKLKEEAVSTMIIKATNAGLGI